MKRNVIWMSSMIVALGFSQSAYQNQGNDIFLAPRLVNYQGFLTDTLGNPVTNPSLSMVFSIWNASAAGTQKWTETQSIAVEKGIFHVLLGNITPIPDTVFTASTTRYLQISVGGSPLTPRTRIVSAPYAYTSTFADTAQYAVNVATGGLDGRYVNVAGPDSMYSNSSQSTFKVNVWGGGSGIYSFRDTTLFTNPVIYAVNNGSGAGLYGTATQDDNGSAGVIGKHSNYRPGVYGYYDVFSSVPRVRAGVAAYSTAGPAFYAQSGSLMGVYVDTVVSSAFQVMQTGGTGYYVGSAGWYGVCVDSNNPSYSSIIVNKGGYNGVGVNTVNNDGFAVMQPGRDGFGLWNRAGRYGAYFNYSVSNAIHIDSAGGQGIHIGYAHARGISVDSSRAGYNGYYINKAGASGYALGTAGLYGFRADSAGMSGLLVGSAGDHGVWVNHAARNGLLVTDADSAGVKIINADDDAINIGVGDYGVYIDSTRNDGVYVRASAGDCFYGGYGIYGLYVDSALYDGVYINSPADDGITISSPTGDGIYVGTTGSRGLYVSSAGASGVYVANSASYGVYANSNTQRGGYFRNDNNTYYTLTAWNNTGTGGTINGAYIQGHGYATGGWQTFLADGKTGFAPSMPEQDVIVSGSGLLDGGRVSIAIDPAVAAAFSPDMPVRVIVTPTSECNGLCVTEKSSSGFQVKELLRGSSDATFDWIVIARAKGYEKTIYTPPIIAEDPIPAEPDEDPIPEVDHKPRLLPDKMPTSVIPDADDETINAAETDFGTPNQVNPPDVRKRD